MSTPAEKLFFNPNFSSTAAAVVVVVVVPAGTSHRFMEIYSQYIHRYTNAMDTNTHIPNTQG